MKKSKKISLLIAALLVFFLTFAACSSPKQSNTSLGGVKKQEGPTKISILSIFYSQEPVPKDNAVLKELEKRTNTDLDIQWVSANSFEDKVATMVASGDMPDYTRINNYFSPQIIKMARDGAFWDITPYLKEYKNLLALGDDVWKFSKIEGKNYGVPKPNFIYGGTYINIRTDWMKTLGLKDPQNMDELYAVLKAFTKADLDKNGKEDTVGITINKGHIGFFENMFNQMSGDWKLVNGKLENKNVLPGTKKALEWLANAYKEGVIPKDFAVMNTSQTNDLIRGNKAGAQINTMNESTTTEFNVKKIDANAQCWTMAPIAGGEGQKIYPKNSAFFGVYVIPKRSVKEDKMKKILAFADYGWSPEGSVLCKWGFENEHHTKVGELYIKTEKGLKDPFGNLDNIFQPASKYGRAAGGTGVTVERYNTLVKIIDEQIKYGVDDLGQNLISDTWVKVGPDFSKQLEELKVQIIIGKKTLADWDEYIQKLKTNADWYKYTQEINDSYNKNK